MPVNKWLYEEWKVCTQITVTQQTEITVIHLSHFAEPVKCLWQQKSICYDCICIVDYVKISKRLSDNIRKTKIVASVKISSHDASFTSSHLNFISFGRHTI